LQCVGGFDVFCIPPNIHPKRIGTHPGNASEKSASPGQRAESHGLFDRVNMTGGAFAIVRGLRAQLFMQDTILNGAGRLKTICNNSGKVKCASTAQRINRSKTALISFLQFPVYLKKTIVWRFDHDSE